MILFLIFFSLGCKDSSKNNYAESPTKIITQNILLKTLQGQDLDISQFKGKTI